jgi:hypothetical protein
MQSVVYHDSEVCRITGREAAALERRGVITRGNDGDLIDLDKSEEVYVFAACSTWPEFDAARGLCLQLTAADVHAVMCRVVAVNPYAPVKFNLSLMTEEELRKGVVRAATVDPCGLDLESIVFDLGAGSNPDAPGKST